jgi:aminobenzoyl-glutamate utilization protein A
MDWAGANDADVVAMRRDLHAHPELGFLEYRTASLVAARLARLGYDVKAGPEVMRAQSMVGTPTAAAVAQAQRDALAAGAPSDWIARMPDGQTGVVGQLVRGAGPVLAFRFDMDALPVAETLAETHAPNREAFRSRRDGLMHACGHDGHTAIGLALAERLANPASGWQGTLRLIFQPAEEGGRGAAPMVEAGIVDDVDYFFAAHLGCKLPTGQISEQATGFLFSRKLDVTFRGKAAHAAMGPQEGRNALLAAATATLGLHAIARHSDEVTHVNVGRLVAGTGRNIIADTAEMLIEVRGESDASLDYMAARAMQVLHGAALTQGVTVETAPMGATIGAVATPAAAAIVAEVGGAVPGIAAVVPGWPIGGGDDATFMVRRVQARGGIASYFILGCDIPAGHHATNFDIDERALPIGVDLFAGIAGRVLGAGR